MSRVFLALVIVIFHLICAASGQITMHVISNVPDKPIGHLQVHCKSGDDDLKMRTLNDGGEFNWTFLDNIIETTLYFCHFYWGSKDRVFDVFNRKIDHFCSPGNDNYDCYWVARVDGFYISRNKKEWTKMYDWM